ncbi:MAG: ubiquitin-like domain-containing protein [Bacillota bacterium]
MKSIKIPPAVATVRPVWVIAGVAIVIFAASIFGFAWDSKTVTLVDGENEVTVETRSSTVGEFLESQKIVLSPEDKVSPELTEDVAEGSRILIKRAYRITISVDKEKTEFYSAAQTVGDVLKEKQVALNPEDIVVPEMGTLISGEQEIRVIRVSTVNEEKKAQIPYETRRIPNPDISRGLSRTVSQGRNGEEMQAWKVTYHDGQEVSRELVNRKEISKPVEKVLQVGTGQSVSRGGNNIRFKEAMEVTATAYTYTGNNTANGTKPAYGTVAVDPRVIPFGTKLYIEGYGYGTALDKGSAIKGNKIDVFVESESEARRWGVKRVKIYILN